jgi:glycine/D-amino acid oxidase-like deaminating enzyme
MKTVLIVGGGFFGMYLAEHLSKKGCKVVLAEKDRDFMRRASLVNQARVHNGYHYPRSVLTALRSRISFPRFVEEFGECIDSQFDKYYMVGKVLGKVTGKQFEKFCHRIGAPCEPAPSKITNWVNPCLIESVYQTVEYAFDSVKLKELMVQRLSVANVDCRLGTEVISVRPDERGRLNAILSYADGDEEHVNGLDHVFNCTYSMINAINIRSGIDMTPLKHEMTEMALVQIPEELNGCGVTVMCGPFFSFMPFPSRSCHSFSHVRYTPHYEWYDRNDKPYVDAHRHYAQVEKQSAWGSMWRDAARYMPILEETRYLESIWEVKTVLPRSESDDSRPILFRANHGVKGYHCIMGGKIDNVYDALSEIDRLGLVD